jgi:hypothetical protein
VFGNDECGLTRFIQIDSLAGTRPCELPPSSISPHLRAALQVDQPLPQIPTGSALPTF